MNSNYKTDNGEVVTALSKVTIHYSDSWEVEGYRQRAKASYADYANEVPQMFDEVASGFKIMHMIKFKGKSLTDHLNSVARLLGNVNVVRYSHYADPHFLTPSQKPDYEKFMRESISRGLGRTIAENVASVEIRAEKHSDSQLAKHVEKEGIPDFIAYGGERVQITAECVVLPIAHYEELLQTIRGLQAIVTNVGH